MTRKTKQKDGWKIVCSRDAIAKAHPDWSEDQITQEMDRCMRAETEKVMARQEKEEKERAAKALKRRVDKAEAEAAKSTKAKSKAVEAPVSAPSTPKPTGPAPTKAPDMVNIPPAVKTLPAHLHQYFRVPSMEELNPNFNVFEMLSEIKLPPRIPFHTGNAAKGKPDDFDPANPPPYYADMIDPSTMLTLREMKFCMVWFKCRSGTKAAIEAGYSPRSAHDTSHKLLRRPDIIDFLKRLQNPVIQDVELSVEALLRQALDLATANITNFLSFDEKGNTYFDLSKATPGQMAAIESMEITEMPPQQLMIDGEEMQREVIKTKIKLASKWPVLKALMEREKVLRPEGGNNDLDNLHNMIEAIDKMEDMLERRIAQRMKVSQDSALRNEGVPPVIEAQLSDTETTKPKRK